MLKKLKRGVFVIMSRFKWILSIMLVLLISFTASAVTLYTPTEYPVITTKVSDTEGNIKIMAYARPSDFLHFEVYVSTLSCFNPTGWNGTAWTGSPNAIEDWNGTTNTLFKISSETPINLTGLVAGTTYYVHLVAVDTYLNRSDPSNEASATAGDYQRSSTFVVAASNAAPGSKYGADYICDGVDDDVQINAALAALPEIEIEGGVSTGVVNEYVTNNTCEAAKPVINGASTDYRLVSSLSATQKHGGTNSLKLVTDTMVGADREYIMGTVSTSNLNGLPAGRKFTFYCWVYVPTGSMVTLSNLNIRFNQYYGGAWVETLSNSPTAYNTWQLLTLDVILNSAATGAYLRVVINEDVDNKTFYFDDFSLTHWNSISLDSSASNMDDEYNGLKITLVSGTGAGQTRTIADYSGSLNRVITLVGEHWDVRPDNTTVYSITAKSGKVLLTEGKFMIKDPILPSHFQTLEGQGNSTLIKLKDNRQLSLDMISVGNNVNVTVKSMVLNGNRLYNNGYNYNGISDNTDAINLTVDKVQCKEFTNYGVLFKGKNSKVSNSKLYNNTWGGVAVKSGFSENVQICNNHIYSNDEHGIIIAAAPMCLISSNHIYNNGFHGVYVWQTSQISISANHIYDNSQSTHNTFSNINLADFTVDCDIQTNYIRKGSKTNKPKWGIAIEFNTSNSNLVTNNDCYTGGETAGIYNAGTGTSFGAGNRNNNGTWSTTPN
jgi:hypothetical protein